MFRVLLHYALLLFALLVSLRWLGACWGPNVMEGAAILTSASELAKQPSRAKGFAQSPGTRCLLEILFARPPRLLRRLTLGFCEEVRRPRQSSKNDEAKQLAF